MKDPEKQESIPIKLPAPTADLEKDVTEMTVDVPYYENFVCSMQYNAKTRNVSPYPEEAQPDVPLATRQSCGNIPVQKWNSGTFDLTAEYKPGTCEGSDWTIDLEKTRIEESEDGTSIEAKCTFKRPFAAGGLREIKFDEELKWMAGFNVYKQPDHTFRYFYGFSYESDKRNKDVAIKAGALAESVWLSLSLAAACISVMF